MVLSPLLLKGCLVRSSLKTSVSQLLDRELHGKVEKVSGWACIE